MPNGLSLAREYHRNLPERIRDYLRRERGIADAVIDLHLLGWNGSRITIPILDRDGRLGFFKLAKDAEDKADSPKMLATPGAHAELYGWERVLIKPEQIIICEGEFDRLVLESHGFGAVTSTGGALTFRPEWAEAFREIPDVFICFDNDEAGRHGAERLAHLIPHARIARLPDEVGDGGDVTDFFVRLGRGQEDFLHLLKRAQAVRPADGPEAAKTEKIRPRPAGDEEVERLKALVAIDDLIGQYVRLRKSGQTYIGRCPFHDDRNPSFVVYPATRSYYCFGCQAHGDVFSFLMQIEKLSFPEAVKLIRELARQHAPGDQKNC